MTGACMKKNRNFVPAAAGEAENADDAADNGKPGKTAGKGFVD